MAKPGFKKTKKLAVEDKIIKTKAKIVDKVDINRLRNQEYKRRANDLFRSAYDSRKRYDHEWLSRDLYRRGYQFSSYNPSTGTVILSTNNKAKVPINLTWAQMRIIRNQITSFRPKWEVLPRSKDNDSQDNARYSGKLLDYYYDKFNLRKKIKDTVLMGLQYSVGGPWQIGFDEEADNGNGEIYAWLIDPYDFYLDPMATCIEEAEYCVKAVRKPLDEIKADPDFNFYDQPVKGEARVAASEYKQFLIQSLKQTSGGKNEEEEGAILKEMWIKERVTDDNRDIIAEQLKENDEDNKDLRQGEVVMRVVTYLDIIIDPLKVQLLRRSDFPFESYQADSNPVEYYGESWIKHVIPMNRVLNALESSIFEYNYRFAKGRLVVDKNSGVRMINNTHGSIIEKNKGSEVTSLAISTLPNSYQIQIDNMRRYIEDIGGAHDVSLGRVPVGIKSGVGIAELKSADATNQRDFVDALEDFLIKVANKILKEIADNYDVPRVIKALGKGGDPEHFAIVGERQGKKRKKNKEVKIGIDTFNLAVIGADNEIRVSVESWLSYTKSGQYERLKELFEAGIIDQKTFLEHAEFNDINSIIESTRKEEFLNKFRGQPAQQGGPTDEEIALQENYQMTSEGKTPDAQPEDNHTVHNMVHQEALGTDGNPLVEAHMVQHNNFIKQGVSKEVTRQVGPPVEQLGEVMPQEVPQQQGPSPEEQALMQSLSEVQGAIG